VCIGFTDNKNYKYQLNEKILTLENVYIINCHPMIFCHMNQRQAYAGIVASLFQLAGHNRKSVATSLASCILVNQCQ